MASTKIDRRMVRWIVRGTSVAFLGTIMGVLGGGGSLSCNDDPAFSNGLDRDEARALLLDGLRAGDAAAFDDACAQIAGAQGWAPSPYATEADRRQTSALLALGHAQGEQGYVARVRRGMLRRVRLNLDLSKDELPPGAGRAEVGVRILGALDGLLRLEDAAKSLRLVGEVDGGEALQFRQYVRDAPVFGSWVQLDLEDRGAAYRLRELSGVYGPEVDTDVTPKLSAAAAVAALRAERALDEAGDFMTIVPPKLWIYDAALLAPECPTCPVVESAPRLAWRIIYSAGPEGGVTTDAFVDARTGGVLFHQPRTDASDVRIYTASNRSSSTCYVADVRSGVDPWYDWDGVCGTLASCDPYNFCWGRILMCAHPDAEGESANEWVRLAHAFFRDHLPSDADLGEHAPYYVYLDACGPGGEGACPWSNAASMSCIGATDIHIFGDGYVSMDVIGHEAGHTYHRSFVNFIYRHESGAIAEHIADALGHLVCCDVGVDCDWLQGEHAGAGGCGRSLENPPDCDGDPDLWSEYVRKDSDDDHGGVHSNNGVLNKAFYLMVQGGVHPDTGIAVDGIGETKAREIYERSIRGLPVNPLFDDFRNRVEVSCLALVGRHGIDDGDCCQVRNAFAAVGLRVADSDCDGEPDTVDVDDDGDGVLDAADLCPLIPDPAQRDLDGDGDGDLCDADLDGDGHDNVEDNCVDIAGPQTDSDGDGVGDLCEHDDFDYIRNGLDNCPTVDNRGQEDFDRDGVGDACDDDSDADGILDDGDGSGVRGDGRCAGGNTIACDDNCRLSPNAGQRDSDGDGVGAACDNCGFVPNVDQQDLDGDHAGDACDPDLDGDGVVNEADLCPEVPGEDGMSLCAPGTTCRLGCPPSAIIAPDLAARMEVVGKGPPDPAAIFVPTLSVPIDVCAFIDCQDQTLTRAALALDVALKTELVAGAGMEAPIELLATVVDESGVRRAFGAASFVSWADGLVNDAEIELRMSTVPSFTWRYGEEISVVEPTEAAVPAYHLWLLARAVAASNEPVLEGLPINVLVRRAGATPADGGADAGRDTGPDAGVDAGGDAGGGGGLEVLADCLALGMEDLTVLLEVMYAAVSDADDPGVEAPTGIQQSVDLDGDGSRESYLSAEIRHPQTTDLSNGMQPGEVVIVDWTLTTAQQPSGSGVFSFPKLSNQLFRVTIVDREPMLEAEATCGPLTLSGYSVHTDVHEGGWAKAFGTITAKPQSIYGEATTMYLTLSEGSAVADVTGTYEEQPFSFALDLESGQPIW
jgi:hypothetical protein